MNVLMIEDLSPTAAATARSLRNAGIDVRCCRDGLDGFACHALQGGTCPLETTSIDALVAVKEGGDSIITFQANRHENPSLGDAGVVCAIRRHVPMVMVCDSGDPYGGPFDEWIEEACVHDEVPEVVSGVVAGPAREYSHIATESLRAALELFEADGTESRAWAVRQGGRIHVTIELPEGTDMKVAEACSVKVLGALHAFDPWTATIDVSTC